MFRGFDCVHRIPSRSQYSQNSARMSAERFEKNHRGYAYSATRPLGSPRQVVARERLDLGHPLAERRHHPLRLVLDSDN